MKSLTILAALALTANSAMALDTVMGLKGRFDYVHGETKTTPGNAKTSSGQLTTSFLRLVTDAKLNDTTKAKLTLDFQPASAKDNGVTNLVDEAYITKSFGALSALIGKQAVMTGGRENDYSTRDLYLTSKFKSEIVDNVTGISLGYSMAGQNAYLQYLEQTDTRSGTKTDKKIVGLAYYGEFMDKMLMPIVSYHKQGTSRIGNYDNAMSVGLRVNVAAFMVEADYLTLEQEKLTTAGDAKLTSIVTHVRYVHDNFQPFAKYIMEKGKKDFDISSGLTSEAESERTAWEVGLEYVPNKDEDMRYHIVYNNSESKKKSPAPTAKYEEQTIVAGVAFNYNILK